MGEIRIKPVSRDPRIPDFPSHPNYPVIEANGIGWSDAYMYDEVGSEHFVNAHKYKKGINK